MKPTYSWSHLQGVTTHDLLDTSPELPCPSLCPTPALLYYPHRIFTLQACLAGMGDSYLLRTDKGRELPVEIVLRIVEFVVGEDSRCVGELMRLSRPFNSLLQTYERSITLANTTHDPRLLFTNSAQSHILGCRAPPKDTIIRRAPSYIWYNEMRTRHSIIEYLCAHEITSMTDDTGGWPRLPEHVPKVERLVREKMFKQHGFLLLFQLSDCTAGQVEMASIRNQQARFLEGLSACETAVLCCLVEVVGQGFLNITGKVGGPRKDLKVMRASMGGFVGDVGVGGDQIGENWLRECPYFAYVFLAGSKNPHRPDLWAKSELQKGLDEMNEFELGNIMSYASLQSVVWKAFCRKRGCTMSDRWTEARGCVERVMGGYVLC
ncbi:hypothetical protein GLAREA_12303 [Glarea lozoyensis ATCC 20868]|uniref:Uncharacterized protein n=1 Tax=Glarea lozoyensis (strain ATCC 20868 / MF5171) TaxID=1116229 RepID=S3CZ39_GLAL2|nr:uncharacterized protein GLAREA_12303 [Glarea lozoyensis ATCC 20868]EPE31547.1 hypothetical protein GLAREA_12303 [Glarea lozoyensis ATCC 20868]